MTTDRDAARIVVNGGGPLHGEVSVPGAKNSVLKLMAAAILADGVHELTNVPDIADVGIMSDLLVSLGLGIESGPGTLRITNTGGTVPHAPYELVERIRASINVLGPLLGRYGEVTLAMPGGDDFAGRPIDLHIKGLEAMGAAFELRHGDLTARVATPTGRLHGASITLDFPSVGATENLLTAAVHASGETVLDNVAREPEIQDLCDFLRGMGAKIDGVGTGTLTVHGLQPGTLRAAGPHRVVADRIQAATYLAAVAVAGGEIFVRGARPEHMDTLLGRFGEMGMVLDATDDGVRARVDGRLRSVDIATLPYPGIATDYKPLVVTMLAVADSVGIVTENLYPGRFRYVEELRRLGADIRTDGHHAVVRGVARLSGAPVRAPDIRAGAALVVAGLAALGTTTVYGIDHIDRGYEDLVGRLGGLGADVTRLG